MDFFQNLAQKAQPKRRRRLTTTGGINNIFKSNMGALLSFFEQAIKIAHKPTLKQNEEAIATNFKKINGIIDKIDQHINRRMNQYEGQIYCIVKGQIQEMHEQNKKLIDSLNKRIEQKDSEQEMFNIYNQLDYFKSQALKLFNQCKKLRIDVKMLEKRIKEYEYQREDNNLCMQKMKRKYLREKALKNNAPAPYNTKNGVMLQSVVKKHTFKNSHKKRSRTLMEQIRQNTDSVENRSAVLVKEQELLKVPDKKSDKDSSEINIDEIFDGADLTQRFATQPKQQFDFPAINMKKVQSQVHFSDITLGMTANKRSKKDQSVQTFEQHSNSNFKINSVLSNHQHQMNRRGFLPKSGFHLYQNYLATPHLDFNKMQMKPDKNRTAFVKQMSDCLTNNKLEFSKSNDRYNIKQKTFHYG